MKYLVYFCYGNGPHVLETRFSMLSARRALREAKDCEIVIYTDNPAAFADQPVRIRPLSEKELADWAEPHGYMHRRKICLVEDALRTLNGPIALIDSDTYFTKSPLKLFERIGPGRTLLHQREGHLDNWYGSELADRLAWGPPVTSLSGESWRVTADTPMFNSGVIGMDPSDVGLIREMLHALDQLYLPAKFHATDQYAAGVVLQRRTKLSECRDVVQHYWFHMRRDPFRAALSEVMDSARTDEERYARLAGRLPRQRLRGRVRFRVLRALESLGLYKEPHRSRTPQTI